MDKEDIAHIYNRLFSQFSHLVVSSSLWPHGLQPGFLVHHQLPELTQTHVHQVGDVIQLSHPLLSPSSPALNLFQCITQHKKEQNYAICSNMDELEIVILNRVSQKDKVKCHMIYHLYVESKIWPKWIDLWSRNKNRDIENILVVAKGEGRSGSLGWADASWRI